MLKKILYAIIVIVIIVILAMMWQDSKNKQETVLPVDQAGQVETDSPANINQDLDSINVDAGIDTDLNAIDADVKTL